MLIRFLANFIRWFCSIFRRLTSRTGSISGRVTDQAGAGVQDAQVQATDGNNQVFGPVKTVQNGDYSIPRLAPGAYTVTVQAPAGFQNPVPAYVKVRACQDTAHVNFLFAAAQTGSIKGQVTDQAEAGVQGAQATAANVANVASPTAATDANGNYHIPNLVPGTYTVSVQALGFDNPPSQDVQVQAGQDTADINFQLTAANSLISGRVTDKDGAGVKEVQVTATNAQNQVVGEATTEENGNYTIPNLPAGAYTVRVEKPPGYLPARNVRTIPGVITRGINFSLNVVKDFRDRLDNVRFSIETPISIEEANQAVSLFSVVNLLLAGLSQRRVGSEEKIDVLGVLNLYYGLQEGSLRDKITVFDSQLLWNRIESELKKLAKELEQRQSDVDFLNQEAKRQFNLGTSNSVLGNVQFPALFKRYVEIGTDPLLSIDIRAEEKNPLFDKAKLAQTYALLRDLKGLLLQIVRSLSKYGTAATKRVNQDWAGFEARALEVLATVAQERVSDDDQNPWAVLAVLTEKNREIQVVPHVVLGRHGGKLLEYAMEIYLQTKDQLDNFEREHLRNLFQPMGKEFWTDRIRREAAVIKRYPYNGIL